MSEKPRSKLNAIRCRIMGAVLGAVAGVGMGMMSFLAGEPPYVKGAAIAGIIGLVVGYLAGAFRAEQ